MWDDQQLLDRHIICVCVFAGMERLCS